MLLLPSQQTCQITDEEDDCNNYVFQTETAFQWCSILKEQLSYCCLLAIVFGIIYLCIFEKRQLKFLQLFSYIATKEFLPINLFCHCFHAVILIQKLSFTSMEEDDWGFPAILFSPPLLASRYTVNCLCAPMNG